MHTNLFIKVKKNVKLHFLKAKYIPYNVSFILRIVGLLIPKKCQYFSITKIISIHVYCLCIDYVLKISIPVDIYINTD